METPVKILVVDDEMPICELMKINLELAGFSVDIANSAGSAKASCRLCPDGV